MLTTIQEPFRNIICFTEFFHLFPSFLKWHTFLFILFGKSYYFIKKRLLKIKRLDKSYKNFFKIKSS